MDEPGTPRPKREILWGGGGGGVYKGKPRGLGAVIVAGGVVGALAGAGAMGGLMAVLILLQFANDPSGPLLGKPLWETDAFLFTVVATAVSASLGAGDRASSELRGDRARAALVLGGVGTVPAGVGVVLALESLRRGTSPLLLLTQIGVGGIFAWIIIAIVTGCLAAVPGSGLREPTWPDRIYRAAKQALIPLLLSMVGGVPAFVGFLAIAVLHTAIEGWGEPLARAIETRLSPEES